MEWDEAYKTRLPEIDVPHRELFAIIQRIGSMHDPTNPSGIRDVIVDLERLAREHFVSEERLMTRNAYPDFSKHLAAHGKLLMEVKTYENNTSFAVPQLSRVLFNWLMADVLMEDRPLAVHILRLRGTT